MKTEFHISSSLTRMHDRYQSLLIEENEKEENKIVKSLWRWKRKVGWIQKKYYKNRKKIGWYFIWVSSPKGRLFSFPTKTYIHIYIPYVSTHSNANIPLITCARFRLKQMWRLTKAMVEMIYEHWTKRWNRSSCTKLTLSASWTQAW